MSTIKTSDDIQKVYDQQYSERITTWRELGGKHKAANILKVIGTQTFTKVVEFGAGEGSILKYLDQHPQFKELYALEISDSGIKQIKERNLKSLKEIQKFDGYTTPYADEEFDLAYCSHVLEHVEHPRLVLREIKRISKFQVFEVPLDYSKRVDMQVEHLLSYGHINVFTPSLIKFLLKSEGFEIKKELFSPIPQEVLEYNWFENMKFKKTFIRKLKAYYIAHKHQIIKTLLGNDISNEHAYHSYVCFTHKSGALKIF